MTPEQDPDQQPGDTSGHAAGHPEAAVAPEGPETPEPVAPPAPDLPASPPTAVAPASDATAPPPLVAPPVAVEDAPPPPSTTDVPAVATDVPEAVSPAAPATSPGRGGRLAVLAAVVVVTAALAAVAVVLVLKSRTQEQLASYYRPSSAPMTAARDAGRLLFSYDYRTIDKDFAAAKALTTGTLATEYAQTTTKVVRPVAVQNHAVVQATVVGQGISSATTDRVVAVVLLNQVTTSTAVTGQKVDQSRVRLTLVKAGGRWLVSKAEAL